MEKKYEILKDTEKVFLGRKVYRIKALKDFSDIKKGDIGGYVESEKNLSQEGDCWIYGKAVACDNSEVCDNAVVYGNSIARDNSKICDYAIVKNHAIVCDYAIVKDYAVVGHAIVCGYGVVGGDSKVCDKLTN